MRRPVLVVASWLLAASTAACREAGTDAPAAAAEEAAAPGIPAPAGEGTPSPSPSSSTTTPPTSTTSPATTAPATTAPPTTAPPTTAPPTTAPVPDAPPAVFDFAEPGSAKGWSPVNDPVMGGRSESTVVWADGGLEFAGTVSLENNGGFASVVSPGGLDGRWAGRDAVVLRGVGDGSTYVLQLRAGPDGSSYVARFVADGSFDVRLPFREFEATTRFLDPRDDAPPLDPASVGQLALYILDGQEGPFALRLTAIG